jgi:hypothetical protein
MANPDIATLSGMAVTLQPMSSDDIGPWLEQSTADHIADRIDIGEDPDTARRTTNAIGERLFPGGVPAAGQYVFVVAEDGLPVGSVWLGTADDGPPDKRSDSPRTSRARAARPSSTSTCSATTPSPAGSTNRSATGS